MGVLRNLSNRYFREILPFSLFFGFIERIYIAFGFLGFLIKTPMVINKNYSMIQLYGLTLLETDRRTRFNKDNGSIEML